MKTRDQLSPADFERLSTTSAWNFTIGSDYEEQINAATAIAFKYGMVPDPHEIGEILGPDPRTLAEKFRHSVRFVTPDGKHPSRLQAWEFAGEAGEAFEESYMIAGAQGMTGGNYFMVLDGKRIM